MARKAFIGLVIAALLVAALPVVAVAPVQAADMLIGMSLPTDADPFFVGMMNGAEAAAEDMGAKVVVTTAENDADQELANVADLLDQGVEVLVVSPVGGELNVAVAEAADEAGIPLIVVIDAEMNTSALEEMNVAGTVMPFEEHGGWLAAGLLCESLTDGGIVYEVVGASSADVERSDGFNQYMGQHCEMVTVQVLDASEMDEDAVFDALNDLLSSDEEVNGVVTYNEAFTLAATDAAASTRTQATVDFVGFDATDDVMSALQNEYLMAVVSPIGWLLGSAGVESAVDVLNGEAIEARILVNMGVLNLDSVLAFRGGPGEETTGDPDSDVRSGNIEGGPSDGQVEGGPTDGQVEGGPSDGQVEGGPSDGQVEGGPSDGQVEGGPSDGQVEGGPSDGQVEGGPSDGQVEGSSGGSEG